MNRKYFCNDTFCRLTTWNWWDIIQEFLFFGSWQDISLILWWVKGYDDDDDDNLVTPYAFVEVVKVTNPTRLWDANIAWYSPSVNCQICLYGLKHIFRIHIFKPIWLYLIAEVCSTQVKCLQTSGYWTVFNCSFTFCMTNVIGCFYSIMVQIHSVSSQIRLHCMFICIAFKSYMEWRNAHHVRALTTIILPSESLPWLELLQAFSI